MYKIASLVQIVTLQTLHCLSTDVTVTVDIHARRFSLFPPDKSPLWNAAALFTSIKKYRTKISNRFYYDENGSMSF